MCSGLVQAGKSTFQNAFVAMFIIETKTQKLYEINPANPQKEAGKVLRMECGQTDRSLLSL